MTKIGFLGWLLLFPVLTMGQIEPSITRSFTFPLTDPELSGLRNIKGVTVGNDLDGDGKKEIAVTNHLAGGIVHLFEVVGQDSLKLVWTSPVVATGDGSTPNVVLFTDLDGDGLGEILYQVSEVGILLFEWDGVVGSDKYGTTPSQRIQDPVLPGVSGRARYLEVCDADGDGNQELIMAFDGSLSFDDGYYIFQSTGNWSTDTPGGSSFTREYFGASKSLTAYGLDKGQPWMMMSADLDGDGDREMLLHNWSNKIIVPLTATAPDTYALVDATSPRRSISLGLDPVYGQQDDVALLGGVAYDIDGNGRQEVFLPTYRGNPQGISGGWLHMLSWDTTQTVPGIDSSNVTVLDLSSVTGRADQFGIGYGDIDKDDKPNLYIGGGYPYTIVTAEFQGGDIRDTAQWDVSVLYRGESDLISSMTISIDSLGAADTVFTQLNAYVSGFYARNTDLDGDGQEDIIIPYGVLMAGGVEIPDSIGITTYTWNASTRSVDTTFRRIVNSKRASLRVLEAPFITGVKPQEWVIITPDDYRLEQNYPNPFNPVTSIRFTIPSPERLSLKIYDVAGRLMRTLLDAEDYPSGSFETVWDGRSDNGVPVASGTYFYSLSWGNYSRTKSMVLLK